MAHSTPWNALKRGLRPLRSRLFLSAVYGGHLKLSFELSCMIVAVLLEIAMHWEKNSRPPQAQRIGFSACIRQFVTSECEKFVEPLLRIGEAALLGIVALQLFTFANLIDINTDGLTGFVARYAGEAKEHGRKLATIAQLRKQVENIKRLRTDLTQKTREG
jgi:hypothetical protein